MVYEKDQKNNSSERQSKKKIIIAEVDIQQQARDAAEERLLSSKAELKGFSGFFSKIWRHNLAHEYYRQREIARVRREIKQSGNIYVGENGAKSDHENAMAAIVERFSAEYESENLLRKGEKKKVLVSDNLKDKAIKDGIQNLIKKYAAGELTDDQFNLEKNSLLNNNKFATDEMIYHKESVYADNLLEMAKQIKQNIAHGQGLDVLDRDFEIVIGKARTGVETETKYNSVDRVMDKIQKTSLGKVINEATLASAVAIVYGFGVKGSLSTAQRVAKWIGPLGMGLSASIGGGVAGLRENKRIKEDRAQHAREMAKGKIIEKDSTMREEMEKFRYETKDANVLANNLKEALEALKGEPNEQKLSEVLNDLNEIESRIAFSEQEQIDLISFSDSKNVEQERTRMYIEIAEAKVYLKKNIHAEWATFYNDKKGLNNYLEHSRRVKIQNVFLKEKTFKDELFNKMKSKKVALAVTKGMVIGLGVGFVAQEVDAYLSGSQEGLFSSEVGHAADKVHHYTALESLRRYLSGDMPQAKVFHEIIQPGNSSSHAEMVATKDFVKSHENIFSKIKREYWADNDSLKPDKNELRLRWGGEKGTGMDARGNYVFNIKHMMRNDSFHGNKHWDPQELMQKGKMKMLISLSEDTKNQVVEVAIDADGNAVIDPNSEIGKVAFKNVGGHAKFLGKFAEVAAMGDSKSGVDNVSILATHTGEGIKNITDIVETHGKDIKTTVFETLPADFDTISPYVFPVAVRKPLEKLGEKKKEEIKNESKQKNTRESVETEADIVEEILGGAAAMGAAGVAAEMINHGEKEAQKIDKTETGVGASAIKAEKDLDEQNIVETQTQAPVKPIEILAQEPVPEPKTSSPGLITVPEIIIPARSMENIDKPERKNWWEVKRETEVMAIEDLDGNMKIFEKHVKELGVAKKDASGNWQWTGGNKKLVFLGDILGDRGMDGMQITSIIGDLASQAEKQGGQIDFLCGNHDMEFIYFLSNSGSEKYAEKNANHFTSQAIGTWELAQFDPDPNSALKKIDPLIRTGRGRGSVKEEFKNNESKLWSELYKKIPEILANMRTNPEGRKILENICQIKVAMVHEDTLFCHTDPTSGMILDLTKDGNITQRVSEINKIFQENLRKVIFQGEKLDDDCRNVEEIYLNAGNRDYFVEDKTFENFETDLLATVAENLYKNKKIEIGAFFKEYVDEVGFKNQQWDVWYRWLFEKDSRIIDIDKSIVHNYISQWKRKNDISGEYTNEVLNIFNKIKRKNNKIGVDEHNLEEKIKNLNPVENNIEKVKNSGINAIIHGHSPVNYREYDENNFLIVSPHSSFDPDNSANSGISTTQKNGKVDFKGKSFRDKKPATSPDKTPAQKPKTPNNSLKTPIFPEIPLNQSQKQRERQERQKRERELNDKFTELKNLDPPKSRIFGEDLEYVMKNPNGKMREFLSQTKLNIVGGIIHAYSDLDDSMFDDIDAFNGADKNERFEINSLGFDPRTEIGDIDLNRFSGGDDGTFELAIKKRAD